MKLTCEYNLLSLSIQGTSEKNLKNIGNLDSFEIQKRERPQKNVESFLFFNL